MVPKWALKLPWNLISRQATSHNLDPALVGAFIQVESSGKGSRSRFEPAWGYFLTPDLFAKSLGITRETEEIHQKTSWGLMQIMGGVARELGFTDNLPKLIVPAININFGCMHLSKLIAKYQALPDAIASYNAGSPRKTADGKYVNQDYVDKVTNCHLELS